MNKDFKNLHVEKLAFQFESKRLFDKMRNLIYKFKQKRIKKHGKNNTNN